MNTVEGAHSKVSVERKLELRYTEYLIVVLHNETHQLNLRKNMKILALSMITPSPAGGAKKPVQLCKITRRKSAISKKRYRAP